MKNIKKTTITVETERVLLWSRLLIRQHCPHCNEEVGMLAIQEAAIFCGLSQQTIRRQMEEQKLHVKEADGQTLICFNSLTR